MARSGEPGGSGGGLSGAQLLVVVLVGCLGLIAAGWVGAAYAERQWGVRLTTDGLVREERLADSVEAAADGPFAFLSTQPEDPSRPVVYDPCQPIPYELNDALAPAGSRQLVEEAVASVAEATGLFFEYTGTTDRVESKQSIAFRPRREPVLIVWSDPASDPMLEGDVAGVGGSVSVEHRFTGDQVYVTGTVVLDAPQLRGVLDGPDGRALVRAILKHELAHVVGLDHVRDPIELMHPRTSDQTEWGPGDLAGLAILGSGRCYS